MHGISLVRLTALSSAEEGDGLLVITLPALHVTETVKGDERIVLEFATDVVAFSSLGTVVLTVADRFTALLCGLNTVGAGRTGLLGAGRVGTWSKITFGGVLKGVLAVSVILRGFGDVACSLGDTESTRYTTGAP